MKPEGGGGGGEVWGRSEVFLIIEYTSDLVWLLPCPGTILWLHPVT